MNPDTKTKWIAALRSGEYAQNREGNLRRGYSYCCLGVLCKIAGAEMGETKTVELEDEEGAYTAIIACSAYFSPTVFTLGEEFTDSLRHHFGLSPTVDVLLMEMNDGKIDQPSKSFSEIADYIETHDMLTGKALAP